MRALKGCASGKGASTSPCARKPFVFHPGPKLPRDECWNRWTGTKTVMPPGPVKDLRRFVVQRVGAVSQITLFARGLPCHASTLTLSHCGVCLRVKGDIPDDDPQVLTAMSAALRMTPDKIEALPMMERQAAIALRTDAKFAKVRERVKQSLGLDDLEFDTHITTKDPKPKEAKAAARSLQCCIEPLLPVGPAGP